MTYIQAVSRCVNMMCCRNTIESEVRSALLTTTSFNTDSVPLLSHRYTHQSLFLPQPFSQSICKCSPPPIFLFFIDLFVKGNACFMLTMLPGHRRVWPPPIWLQMCFYGCWRVRIGPSAMNCRHGQVDKCLPLCFDFMVWIYIILAVVYIDIWSLNHQYLCNFYVLIFTSGKGSIKTSLKQTLTLSCITYRHISKSGVWDLLTIIHLCVDLAY